MCLASISSLSLSPFLSLSLSLSLSPSLPLSLYLPIPLSLSISPFLTHPPHTATILQLSLKYQALVTPNGWAFSIWGPIFILEGIFAIYQMFGNVRASETVEAIAYPYMWSCFAQVMWTIVFAQEWIGVSLFFMLSILVALVRCLSSFVTVSLSLSFSSFLFLFFFSLSHSLSAPPPPISHPPTNQPYPPSIHTALQMWMQYSLFNDVKQSVGYRDWWLLQAGPLLHLGWIIAASAVNTNVCVVSAQPVTYNPNATAYVMAAAGSTNEANSIAQLGAAIASLGVVIVLGLFQSTGLLVLGRSPTGHFRPQKAGTITAFAVSWALFGVVSQLAYPKGKTILQFSPIVINGVKVASLFGASLIAAAVGVNILLLLAQVFVPHHFGRVEDEKTALSAGGKAYGTNSSPITDTV